RKLFVLVRIMVPELWAPTFVSFQRCERDRFRNCEQILQIKRSVPARVVFAITCDCDFFSALLETVDLFQSLAHFAFGPYDPNQILHSVLQIFLHLVRTFAVPSLERSERLTRSVFDSTGIDLA